MTRYSFMYESSDLRDGETLREYRARAAMEARDWRRVVDHADDTDMFGYGASDGIVRVGRSVFIRFAGRVTRSDHATDVEAIDAFILASSLFERRAA